jgi:hypothetical protein
MLKWLTIVVSLVAFGLFAIAYLQGRSLRHAGIIEGRAFLKIAAVT